jgi:hypothetical protein
MPILLWIAFWSSMTGVARGWQETVLPIRLRAKDRRDRTSE